MSTPSHTAASGIPTRAPPPPPPPSSAQARFPHDGDHHILTPHKNNLSIVKEEGTINDRDCPSPPLDAIAGATTSRAEGYHRRELSDLTQNNEDSSDNHQGESGITFSSSPSISDQLTLSEKEAAKAAVTRFSTQQKWSTVSAQRCDSNIHITLEDLSPTMDQQVEAALVDAMERTEKQQKKKTELLKSGAHRRNRSSMGAYESARVLENITEDAVQLFLSHPNNAPDPPAKESNNNPPDAEATSTRRTQQNDASDDSPNNSRHNTNHGHNHHNHKHNHNNNSQNSLMPDADIVHNAHQGVPAAASFRETLSSPALPSSRDAQDVEMSPHQSPRSAAKSQPSGRPQLVTSHQPKTYSSGRRGFASLVQDMQQAHDGKLHSLEKYKSTRSMGAGLTKSPPSARADDSVDTNISVSAESQSRTSKQSGAANTHTSDEHRRSHKKSPSIAIKGGGLGGNVSDTDLFYQNAAMMFKTANNKGGAEDAMLFASADDDVESQRSGLRQRVIGNHHAPPKKAGWATLKAAVALGAVRNINTPNNDNADDDGTPVARVASATHLNDADLESPQVMEDDGGEDWNHDNGNTNGDINSHNPSQGRTSQRPGARKSKGRCDGGRQYLGFIRLRSHQVFQFRSNLWKWLKASGYIIKFIGIPLIGTAALLYYVFDNPLTTRAGGSVSWWLILTFRWVLTRVLSRIFQYLLLDCIALRSSVALNTLGPITTLTLMQSRGWPFELVCWCIFNFAMLYGTGEFAQHWLFYQPFLAMFNANNQSGTFLTNKVYLSVLIAGIVLGILTALKRTAVSLFLGRRTCGKLTLRACIMHFAHLYAILTFSHITQPYLQIYLPLVSLPYINKQSFTDLNWRRSWKSSF
jgi:hypothetical protein